MSNRYLSEKGIPTVPVCSRSPISLRFDGRILIMITPTRTYMYWAVSGRPIENKKFDYSIARQKIADQGPIPIGRYWIEPSQMWENHWYNLAPSAAWGRHRITIHIYPGTQTYSRGGFFIHGGTHAGSAGCINLHIQMEKFAKDLREALNGSSDCYIPLWVRY